MNRPELYERIRTPGVAWVLGLGASGQAAARLLRAFGWRVTLLEERDDPARQIAAKTLQTEGIPAQCGDQSLPETDCDLVVTSPGWPGAHPWLQTARQRGLRLVPEFELGAAQLSGRLIAITGSNGKSTAVAFCAAALAAAGRTARIAGNGGPAVCDVARTQPHADYWVLEASSFQLAACRAFAPDHAVLLNLQPNHEKQHGSWAAYVAAKCQIFQAQQPPAHAWAPAALWPALRPHLPANWPVQTHDFAGAPQPRATAWADAQTRVWRGPDLLADLHGTYFDDEALRPAAAAVCALTALEGVPPETLRAAALAFHPLPHRFHIVARHQGVTFINDSKATSLASLEAALRRAPGPVHLIAGGLSKGEPPEGVKETLALRAQGVYLIGKIGAAWQAAWQAVVPCTLCGELETAVQRAAAAARPGDCVLLAPGCASFDQFADFAARGEAFCAAVRSWSEATEHGKKPG